MVCTIERICVRREILNLTLCGCEVWGNVLRDGFGRVAYLACSGIGCIVVKPTGVEA